MTQDDGLFAFDVEEPELEAVEPEVVEALAPLPAVVDYDTQKAITRLFLFEKKVNDALAKSRKITAIRDDATNTLAAESAAELTRLIKDVEAARKHFTAPHTKFNSGVNDFAKKYSDPLTKELAPKKAMLIGWDNAQKIKKAREEAALREEQRKIQAAVEEEAQKLRDEAQKKVDEAAAELDRLKTKAPEGGWGDQVAALEKTIEDETAAANAETPLVAGPVVAVPNKVVRTNAGSVSFSHDWTWEVTNLADVPRDCLMLDEKAINQRVKGGERNIPGLHIFERTTPKIKA